MPIYGYRCTSCGAQKDVMQKIADAPLTACPECGQETFTKQLSAAGVVSKIGSGVPAQPASCGSCCACPMAGGHA
jgi:putative FmdB family regulatory protein